MTDKLLNNVKKIEVINGISHITYLDNTKYVSKDDITLVLDYKNDNDIPLNDHCL